INGQGGDSGIDIQDAGQVRIENCVVSGMSSMGIFHRAASAQVIVRDTIVRDNFEGIRMVTDVASLTLERVIGESNLQTGLYISPNAATGRLDVTVTDSLFGSNGIGIRADAGANAAIFASIDRSTLTENPGGGVKATGSSSAQLYVTVQRSTLRRN